MSFRVKASAIAVSAAICTLLAPAAMASAGVSHAPVQVTGKKLKSGLLPPTRLVTKALWTIAGTNVYMIDSALLNVQSPKPALSSLMLKLIARVRALR
jgi:hypothetical protein